MTFAPVVLTVAALLACRAASAQQPADVLRLARYTTAPVVPDIAQTDPLEATVRISLPRSSVGTVGDALTYVLLRTGYRLGPHQQSDPRANAVLSMPLPEVHRDLGPYSVRTALSVLLGAPFELSVDAVQRLVSFRTKRAATAEGAPSVGMGESGFLSGTNGNDQ